MSEKNEKAKTEVPKKKGPIRFEAIIPVTVISLLTFVYFTYYFDHHMKKLIEYVGTQANGAEVNVDAVRTSFIRGSFDLDRLQVTDPKRPTHNSLEIGNMHFQYLWDALLRMKFVVDDASINNIQLLKPRTTPGKVLPPEPAKPSKIDEIQLEVLSQVKNKYGANMLGDALAILESGGDYEGQLQSIRGTLKSEARVNAMVTDVQNKKQFWDGKVKELSDTSKLKEIETALKTVKAEKNFVKQAQGVKQITDLLNDVKKQYNEIEESSKKLQAEVKAVADYPKELQALVNEDIASLKNRFSIPQLDFKDMAMHLFAGQFAEYIAKARTYKALADQYLPEKKEPEDVVIPPKRSEGKNYDFPITTGYPLFWLKRAAISSQGTADTYTGQVTGELTNVTTSPKQIKKPVVLDIKGDFPDVQVLGVKALITADFTQDISRQSALVQVDSFAVPEKMFVDDKKIKFGFVKAYGNTSISATLQEQNINMIWNAAFKNPNFVVDTSNKLTKELLTNVVNNIPVISLDGKAYGTYKNLNMDITSNLGTELSQGITREVGAKLTEAQNKINALVEEKIKDPKATLMSALNGNNKNLSQLSNLEKLFKDNEDKIKAELNKLKSGGGEVDKLKDKGKKLLKGIKF